MFFCVAFISIFSFSLPLSHLSSSPSLSLHLSVSLFSLCPLAPVEACQFYLTAGFAHLRRCRHTHTHTYTHTHIQTERETHTAEVHINTLYTETHRETLGRHKHKNTTYKLKSSSKNKVS